MSRTFIERKVVILGSGPAGLTAAIYASRAQLEPLVIDGPQPGGQLTITTDVENYPGFAKGIMGPELMNEFREQALRFGTEIINVWIDRVDLSERPFTLYGKESQDAEDVTTEIKADTLIISTGASAKWLGIPGEEPVPEGLGGNGVSACATCDGFFFRGKPIVVVGGGDTAMEEALFLTRFASEVTVIHRRNEFRASKIMADRVLGHEKIKVLWNTEVTAIHGSKETGVESISLFNNQTNEASDHPTQGVFIAIGHKPNTELFEGVLDMDDVGYLITEGRTMKTNVPGVYACGDAQDSYYRQAITAAGTGCMAAIDAERFLAEHEEGSDPDAVKAGA
ncbi:MAG TPA: thioredoxin-disulfide reductase [Pyrinomonadaceae bacterium]|nr:thioredoxin-disulfide reductase [Chloracidobacterium sp.]HBE81809.1 thioredoxin-disulfide reductase [Blastocatellia bacterium]HRJ87716.1 thioredoxin-disulfide reductase [Pyrinomonadaceae bacterium]HRK51148.1 thioredoxin-disulfide reductase [Pyrinomonadaceae bacterium]